MLRRRLRPIARDCDEKDKLPADLLEKVWGLGFCPNIIPEKFGGYEMGRSALNAAIMVEELAWGDVSLAIGALSPLVDGDSGTGVWDGRTEGGMVAQVLRGEVLPGHGGLDGEADHL